MAWKDGIFAIIRAILILSAIVVFGTISSTGVADWYQPMLNGTCVYNGNSVACDMGVAIGVITLLYSLPFVIADVLFMLVLTIGSKIKRLFLSVDTTLHLIFLPIWLATFAILAKGFGELPGNKKSYLSDEEYMNAQASVAFAFFAFLTTCVFAVTGLYRLCVNPPEPEPSYEKM
eukprot:m.308224 g.308224  ORF g.308224 m.308224 type:complete len:175 (+) comp43596_c0_seq1:67-591(+)